jgi:hypothetical protein
VNYCIGDFDTSNNHHDFQLDYSVTSMIKKVEDAVWFHDLTGRKHVYKQGFKQFLEVPSNWKYLLK